MWPLWTIIVVAVGGAVSLTITSVLTVVYFERRRHKRLMAQHGLDPNPGQTHRHHLSITDVDVTTIPRAAKSLRDSYQRPRSESIRFYATIPSQDEIRTFPEGTITDSVVDASHSQPTDVRTSHQWLAPSRSKRFKRKKKIAKVSTSLAVTRSPMSAITETTESNRGASPEPIELPTHITPEITPERAGMPVSVKVVRDSNISIDSILIMSNAVGLPQGTSHGAIIKSRSISMGSIAPPPNIPLPPVPNTAPFDQQRRASLSRSKSDISLHKREVSALSQLSTSIPVHGAFSGFRFELTGDDVSREGGGRATPLSKDQQVSFRFPKPEDTAQNPEESFKTIDASTWNLPNSLRLSRPITPTPSTNNSEPGSRSVSMIDYDAIFSAGSSLNNSPTKPYDGPLSRPVSALSVSSADMFRLSVIGSKVSESPRAVAHKRQNCVRIKNLTPVENKKRLSSQLGRLTEAEEDNDSVLLPSPSRVGTDQAASINVLPASAALGQNESASASDSSLNVPVIKQPQALSLRVKRPGWTSIKDKNKAIRPLPVPGDPVKHTQILTQLPETANDPTVGRKVTEVVPTVLEAIKTSGTDVSVSPISSIRTYSPNSPQRQRAQIHGPRNAPPPSLRVRKQTLAGSPIRRKSSENERVNKQHLQKQRDQKISDADLRKSIALLRNMTLPETLSTQSVESPPTMPVARTPSARYVDSPSIKVPKIRNRSNTVAGHAGDRVKSRPSSPNPSQTQQKNLLNTETTTTQPTHKLTYSPSSISIWEDDSVRGDSPEPVPPTSTQSQPSPRHQKPSTSYPNHQPTPTQYSPVKSHRAHFDNLSTYTRTISSALPHHHHYNSQYQQLGNHPQIQRESLWKLQQNADVITTRALALSGSGRGDGRRSGSGSGVEKLPTSPTGRKRIVSPRTKGQDTIKGSAREREREGSPISPIDGSGNGRGSAERTRVRMRSHTVATAARPTTQTACEGVGLGLKFGERSMAYTVNEMGMDRDRVARVR